MEENDYFLTLSLAIAWFRGLTYLNIFRPLRYLVTMVLEVLIDMKAFIFLIMYSILAVTFMKITTKPDQIEFS